MTKEELEKMLESITDKYVIVKKDDLNDLRKLITKHRKALLINFLYYINERWADIFEIIDNKEKAVDEYLRSINHNPTPPPPPTPPKDRSTKLQSM